MNLKKYEKMFFMASVVVLAMLISGCSGSSKGTPRNDTLSGGLRLNDEAYNKKDIKIRDMIPRDVAYPDLNRDASGENLVCPKAPTSNNPNAWKDAQECQIWKRIKPVYKCFGYNVNPNHCECGKPPYCWCVMNTGAAITPACSPDNKTCCNFTSTCIPCGWHKMTQAEMDAKHWDPSIPIQDEKGCEEPYKMTQVHLDTEYRACYEWKTE